MNITHRGVNIEPHPLLHDVHAATFACGCYRQIGRCKDEAELLRVLDHFIDSHDRKHKKITNEPR